MGVVTKRGRKEEGGEEKRREEKQKGGKERSRSSPPQAPLGFEEVLEGVVLGVGLHQPQVVLGVPPPHARGGALGALAQTRCGAWVCFGANPIDQIA